MWPSSPLLFSPQPYRWPFFVSARMLFPLHATDVRMPSPLLIFPLWKKSTRRKWLRDSCTTSWWPSTPDVPSPQVYRPPVASRVTETSYASHSRGRDTAPQPKSTTASPDTSVRRVGLEITPASRPEPSYPSDQHRTRTQFESLLPQPYITALGDSPSARAGM